MKALVVFFIFLLGLRWVVFAESYDYPVRNPFQATLTSVMTSFLVEDDSDNRKKICIEQYPERKSIPFFEGRHKACAELFYQSSFWSTKEAPLVFILGGLGAAPLAPISHFLAQQIYKSLGFHVITIGSPFLWRFNLGALSHATPGAIYYDSLEIYRFMKMVLAKARNKKNLKVTDIYLTGYSLGGLEALFIARQDKQEGAFNFKKVLAINPPVDLKESATLLDSYYSVYANYSLKFQRRIQEKIHNIFFKVSGSMRPEKKVEELLNKFPFGPKVSKAIIGNSFHESFTESLFVTELVNNLGLFPIDRDHYSPQPGLSEARKWTFMRYLDEVLWPFYSKKYPKKSLMEFFHENSMRSLEAFMKSTSSVIIHHNVDDIILNRGDLGFIKRTLGDRVTVFPRGGHQGNIWYSENVRLVLRDLVR